MFTRLAQAALALVLTIPPAARAAQPAPAAPASQAAKRTAVLLIPLDRGAYSPAAQLTEYMEDAIDRRDGYVLRRSDVALGDSTPTQALAARQRVQTAVNEGKKLLAAGSFDDAEASFRSGMADADAAVAAMDRCSEYCEALVHLAAVQVIKGEEEEARKVLGDLLAIDSGYKFEGPAFGKAFRLIYREMQASLSDLGRLGAVAVQSNPPGGRVFIDGQDRGFSPVTVDRLPVGKHLLRIERAGFVTYGQLVEVAGTEASTVKPRLTATTEFSELEDVLDPVVDELERGAGGASMMKLGAKLKADRALIGLVRTKGSSTKVDLVLADFVDRKQVSRSSRVFLGNEYGELRKEVQRFASAVLAAADAPPDPTVKAGSKDPLDHKTGTEDWDEESSGDRAPDRKPEGEPRGEGGAW